MPSLKKVAATATFLAGLCLSGTAMAADGDAAGELASSSNTLFILLGAIMILAMHGGFAFLEVGSVRRKNQVNALNKIICEWGFSTIVYFLIGYPLAYVIAFRGGKYRNLLLGLVVVPFFTSYLIPLIIIKPFIII